MERILARDARGETAVSQEVREALARLSLAQLDRFFRARKVWFNKKTNSFEFEDNYV